MKYHGQTTNVEGSFWADSTGLIKSINVPFPQGIADNQRIGSKIQLKRILVQYVLRWPLKSLTPIWNGRSTTAATNNDCYASDMRNSLTGRIYLIQMDYADGSAVAFVKYLESFKTPFALRQNMVEPS